MHLDKPSFILMSRILILFIPLIVPVFVCSQDAKNIVSKADEKMRGKTFQIEMTIRTVRPTWLREMDIKAWMKGTDYAMIVIQSPAKDKGIVFLKRKKEVWNWMPTLERTIKLPPSTMSQSWMGTDFTNDDLVKESSIVNDHLHSIIGDTTIDNRVCYIIQMIPKPEAAVVALIHKRYAYETLLTVPTPLHRYSTADEFQIPYRNRTLFS